VTEHDDRAMTSDDDFPIDPRLEALLSRADVWADVPDGVEQRVAAAIGREAAERAAAAPLAGAGTDRAADEPVPRRARAGRRALLGVAAATVVTIVAVAALLAGRGSDGDGIVVALAGTELAPGASATADVVDTPAGVRIVLDVDGLEGAPPGSYYEAWMRTANGRVSAGSFHLRGGDGPIELWCGVSASSYASMTVTLEAEGDDERSSDRVVLQGSVGGD
jgi:hypothetical protein